MSKRVLRRNRRKASPDTVSKAPILLFALSLLVFAGGVGNFACAISTHAILRESPAQNQQAKSEYEHEDPYGGLIVSGDARSSNSESSSTSSSASSSASSAPAQVPRPETRDAGEPSSEQAALYDEDGFAPAPGQAQEASQQASEPTGEQPARGPEQVPVQEASSRTVHHEAYRESPVYRTVHHQASMPHEVVSGGYTRIEWTSCPVCGQRHDSAYNERVIDHVNEVYCPACGNKHAEDYDEVIYY